MTELTEIEIRALKAIKSSPDGILQSELWKELDVDSRKCSRIVKKLLESESVERIEYRQDGIKTYRLIVRKGPIDPGFLMAGDELIPCVACELECVIEECPYLLDWMYQLAIADAGGKE